MSGALFSPSWYRVSRLTPRLRGHARVHRHEYRGEIWYVMQDPASGRFFRFTPGAYEVIGRMDGKRSVQQLWDAACETLADDAPTQPEVVHLLGQLHSADVLLCDVPTDTAELLRRSEKIGRAKRLQHIKSPLALRFPLIDPERFLARTVRFVRPVFSAWGFAVWAAVVSVAVVLVVRHWGALSDNVIDRVLSAQNLLVLGLVYPVVKALHELGHGYAVKTWGGEVHEMGVMLLVLMPIPYVDASAASEFRSRGRRAVVGSAGILVETLLASLALFAWLMLEPGLPRSIAYNVMLIGGVSTVIFNGNPLLRFDGYYILADLLEIPNLAQRGVRYVAFLAQRYAFGMKRLEPPHTNRGEPAWLVGYTVTAFVYRMFVYTGIILFIAGKFFIVGILLAIWAAFGMVVAPLGKIVKFLISSPRLRGSRPRALAVSGGVLALLALLLFVVPAPYRTRAEGLVWVPEDALVRTATPGFVDRIVVAAGSQVTRGELLIERGDPLLHADLRVLRARMAELQARYDAARATDQVQTQLLAREIESARPALVRAEERVRELAVISPADGLLVLPDAGDLPARYLQQGDLVGFVIDVRRPIVRVVVPQSRVDLVRRRTEGVEVRLAERLERTIPAVLVREVPAGAESLPSTVLGSAGGGTIAIDPLDRSGTKTFDTLFQFDIELAEPLEQLFIGGRVHVRFDHGSEPLGFQWYRAIRQLLLRRFNV